MTNTQKLTDLKVILSIPSSDTTQDDLLSAYLSMAAFEIIQYKYSLVGVPDGMVEPDDEDVMTQIFAVVAGYNRRGAEDQTSHNENQIYRTFKHEDMVAYIRSRVIPYASVR